MATNCTLIWWFNIFKYQGWYPNMFYWPNFQTLIHLIIVWSITSSTHLFTYYKTCCITFSWYTLSITDLLKLCSDWKKIHKEPNFLKQVFLNNGYPFSLIDNCFKTFLKNLVINRPQIPTFEKNTLIPSLLRNISLRTIFTKVYWLFVSSKLFSKVKRNLQMFSNSKITYLAT